MYIYPNNLKAKPKLWFWELRDIVIIGMGLLLSVFALVHDVGMLPLVVTVLFAFLAIRVEGTCVLDFIHYAADFLFLKQQYYEWRDTP